MNVLLLGAKLLPLISISYMMWHVLRPIVGVWWVVQIVRIIVQMPLMTRT